MSKVVLIIPPRPFLISERVMPQLGVMYVSAVLKERGHQAQIVDMARGDKIPDDADIYGITATTAQFLDATQIARNIKNKYSRVVLGGPHATCFRDKCLMWGFDQVVIGEGERAIVKIAEGYDHPTVREPQIENLDEIPFPDRSEVKDYLYTIDGEQTTTMMTSRGCPYRCAFCTLTWKGIRFRSVKNVLAEARVIKDMGFSGLMLFDDEMLMNKGRDFQIFAGFKELGLVWRCLTRSNLVDDKTAEIMAKCGCREVLLGIESGSDAILKTVKKGTTREMNLKAIATFKEKGIRVKALFMVGLPGETHETIAQTESFVEECSPNDLDFTIFTPFPLSDIYEHPERYDIKFDPDYFLKSPAWYKGRPGSYKSVVATSKLSAEDIVEARDRLEERFKRW